MANQLAMRQAGSINISQDEGTSVVFGMRKAAIDRGAIDVVPPLEDIAQEIVLQQRANRDHRKRMP
jgi:two-component system chemotaxis response regulator CheB